MHRRPPYIASNTPFSFQTNHTKKTRRRLLLAIIAGHRGGGQKCCRARPSRCAFGSPSRSCRGSFLTARVGFGMELGDEVSSG